MDSICEDNRGVENALHAFLLAPTSHMLSIPAPRFCSLAVEGSRSGIFCVLGKALYAENKNSNPLVSFTSMALIL